MHKLDRTDTRLLIALTEDPRSTIVALAEKLGLSRNTVQARMSALDASSVLHPFDRRINPVALGYPLTAFISVHLQQQLGLQPPCRHGAACIAARACSAGC